MPHLPTFTSEELQDAVCFLSSNVISIHRYMANSDFGCTQDDLAYLQGQSDRLHRVISKLKQCALSQVVHLQEVDEQPLN